MNTPELNEYKEVIKDLSLIELIIERRKLVELLYEYENNILWNKDDFDATNQQTYIKYSMNNQCLMIATELIEEKKKNYVN